MARVAGPQCVLKTVLRYETGKDQNDKLFLVFFFLSKSLRWDNSILIHHGLDNKVYLKWAKYTHQLAGTMIQRSTEHQYKWISKYTPLDLSHSDEYGWYRLHLSYDVIVAMVRYWRNGLSEFQRLFCLIDWWSWQTQSQVQWKQTQFTCKVVKVHTNVEQQVGSYLLMCCYN